MSATASLNIPLVFHPDIFEAFNESINGTAPEAIEPLSAADLKILTILLDPINDPSECAEDAPSMLDGIWATETFEHGVADDIAARLRGHYARVYDDYFAFGFDLIADSDGYAGSYAVRTSVGQNATWLMVTAETKRIDPERRGLAGLLAALFIGTTIDADYQRLRAERDTLFGAV